MKTIVFVLALALTSATCAFDIDRITAGKFYVSSYSSAVLFYNMNAGSSINIYAHGGPDVFCGVSTLTEPANMLMADFLDIRGMTFNAWSKDVYIVLCIKNRGVSGNVILLIEDRVKRSSSKNVINESYLLLQLQDEFDAIFD